MTVATSEGFVIGNRYKVISKTNSWTTNGEIVTFKKDDWSRCPLFEHSNGETVYINLEELIPYNEEELSAGKTPAPRFRKKRIAPPVRVKSDVRITYNEGVGYTITNVKQIIVSKDSDAAFITSIIKGIKTQVELALTEIDSIKLKTPTSVYDFHVEGAYPDILVVNPKLGMTASAKYFSLNLED